MSFTLFSHTWSRRDWLATQAAALAATLTSRSMWAAVPRRSTPPRRASGAARHLDRALIPHAATDRIDAGAWEALAERAVGVAKDAGAQYADARITRLVQQRFDGEGYFNRDSTLIGVGVRALVNGYWGYAARAGLDPARIEQLARDAVAQAKTNAKGSPRTVDLGPVAAPRGRWETPVEIDPFTVPIAEKEDLMRAWRELDRQLCYLRRLPKGPDADPNNRINNAIDTMHSWYNFARHERVAATSDGACFTQTLFESGGVQRYTRNVQIQGIELAAMGWERLLNANVEEQIRGIDARLAEEHVLIDETRPVLVGRKTLVCTGQAMAAMLERTLGVATQLDRALGYEANAGGTSYLNDPLAMLGTLQVAAPMITVSGNRTARGQLATVRWDDEGIEPKSFTLVKDGVLTDFQTTRESAHWLAPYYRTAGLPATSHGCAAAEGALFVTMQHMPNLALEPAHEDSTLEALIATVSDGVLLESVWPDEGAISDSQVSTGMVQGAMRSIKNGRLGRRVGGGALLYNTAQFWKKVSVLGGASTVEMCSTSQYPDGSESGALALMPSNMEKGQPRQITSHSVTAPAAIVLEQAIIDPRRRL